MPYQVQPVTASDVRSFVAAYFAAFQDRLSLNGFPHIPSVRDWWEKTTLNELQDPNAHFLKVVDTAANDQLVCIGKWNAPSAPSAPPKPPTKWPTGADTALLDRFFTPLANKHEEIMNKRPHWYLEKLATLPAHRGRGLGSLIMQWGVDRADANGNDAYLEASPTGVALYRKFGFVERDVSTIDVAGVPYTTLCMVREARREAVAR